MITTIEEVPQNRKVLSFASRMNSGMGQIKVIYKAPIKVKRVIIYILVNLLSRANSIRHRTSSGYLPFLLGWIQRRIEETEEYDCRSV